MSPSLRSRRLTVDGPGTGLTREALAVLADAEQTIIDVPAFEPAAPAARHVPVTDPTERDG
jgi:hypothetical protein